MLSTHVFTLASIKKSYCMLKQPKTVIARKKKKKDRYSVILTLPLRRR